MEFLKIQMQMANKTSAKDSKPVSAFKLATDLIKRDGFFSIYRGLTATFLRDVVFSLLYFPGFALLNNRGYGADGSKPAFYHTLVSGLISGCLSAFAVTPLDVIKTRLQFIDNTSKTPLYNGIFDCTTKTYRNDGIKAFFRGSIPRMVVIAPLFGIAQTVYFLGIGEHLLGLKSC